MLEKVTPNKILLLSTLCLGLTSVALSQQTGPQQVNLYNGQDLTGWVQRGDPAAKWRTDGDSIVGSSNDQSKTSAFLCTEKEYGDFILDVDFKVGPDFRGGIQIRSMAYPEYYGGVVHGDQIVIAPKATTGGVMEEGGRHWLYDLKGNQAIVKAFKQDDWNHLTITAVGDTIKTWLNGTEGSNLRDSKTPIGFIALYVTHARTPEFQEMRFKNIRITSLDTSSPPIRTYVEMSELSPPNQKTWQEPTLKQPENKPDKGSATVFKHPPRPPQSATQPSANTTTKPTVPN